MTPVGIHDFFQRDTRTGSIGPDMPLVIVVILISRRRIDAHQANTGRQGQRVSNGFEIGGLIGSEDAETLAQALQWSVSQATLHKECKKQHQQEAERDQCMMARIPGRRQCKRWQRFWFLNSNDLTIMYMQNHGYVGVKRMCGEFRLSCQGFQDLPVAATCA